MLVGEEGGEAIMHLRLFSNVMSCGEDEGGHRFAHLANRS